MDPAVAGSTTTALRRRKTLTRQMRVFEFAASGACEQRALTRMQLLELVRDAYPLEEDFPTEPGAVQPRDLRIVDPDSFAATAEPVIAVRAFAVLFGLYPVRALLLPGRLLVFVADGDEAAERALAELRVRAVRGAQPDPALAPAAAAPPRRAADEVDAEGAVGANDAEAADDPETSADAPLPTELKMLEAVVSVVASQLAGMVDDVVHDAEAKMAAALETPKTAELEKLRRVRTQTDRIKSLVDGVDAALDALLSNEHDLAALSFTHLLSDPSLLRADRPWEPSSQPQQLVADEDGADEGSTALAVARRLARVEEARAAGAADVDDDDDALAAVDAALDEGVAHVRAVTETLAERVMMVIELYDLEVQSAAGRVAHALNELKSTDLEICRELDVARNNLIRIEIVAMTGTTGAVLGSLLTNAFGMNLNSGVSANDSAFFIVTAIAIGGAVLFIVLFMWHFVRSNYVL